MRRDLLALTPEKLASLANLGLVKRAQKESAAGRGPALEEEPDGTVVGRFPDGVVARLVPGKALGDNPCTCDAVATCRHRVAVALAYPAWHASRASPEPAPPVGSVSPGALTDEALVALMGKRAFERARVAARSGVLAEVHRAEASPSGDAPAVRLPTSTVRFLVPGDLTYARCDCATATACEHVALAVWAFREADARDPAAAVVVVQLGGGEAEAPTEGALALARELLVEGVAHSAPSLGQRFAVVRAELERAGLVWPGELVEELEAALGEYRDRSARYGPDRVAGLLAELEARSRAARGGGELPPRFVLGTDQAPETLLDHVRLISLGARLSGDPGWREAEVYLADPDAGMVLVMRKRWRYAEEETPEDGEALASRSVAPQILLGTLAHGMLVSRGVKRLANRHVVLSSSRAHPTSVSRQAGDWAGLPAPIRIVDLDAHRRALRERPPRLLRPRWLGEDVHVVELTRVVAVRYSPGAQELSAVVEAAGGELHLALRHRSCAPAALDALAAALTCEEPRVRWVAGALRASSRGLEMEPLSVVSDRMVVLDLASRPASPPALELGEVEPADAPLRSAVQAGLACLAEGAHHGLLRSSPVWLGRLSDVSTRLDEIGLSHPAASLRRLRDAVKQLQGEGQVAAAAATGAWLGAAIRLELAQERMR